MATGEMIRCFTWDVLDSNAWLLVEGSCGLLFDPVDSQKLYDVVAGMSELLIILTHCHFDHICGLNRLREMKPQARVIATAECSKCIQRPGGNLSNIANAFMAFYDPTAVYEEPIPPFVCAPADEVFEGEMRFGWHGHSVALSEYNGHAAGSLCGVIDDALLFTGDTLLPIPTLTRLPGGSTRRFLKEDMPRLQPLAGRIERVYPGHGAPGRLEDMLLINTMNNERI